MPGRLNFVWIIGVVTCVWVGCFKHAQIVTGAGGPRSSERHAAATDGTVRVDGDRTGRSPKRLQRPLIRRNLRYVSLKDELVPALPDRGVRYLPHENLFIDERYQGYRRCPTTDIVCDVGTTLDHQTSLIRGRSAVKQRDRNKIRRKRPRIRGAARPTDARDRTASRRKRHARAARVRLKYKSRMARWADDAFEFELNVEGEPVPSAKSGSDPHP